LIRFRNPFTVKLSHELPDCVTTSAYLCQFTFSQYVLNRLFDISPKFDSPFWKVWRGGEESMQDTQLFKGRTYKTIPVGVREEERETEERGIFYVTTTIADNS
jgi:hypothetical protein